MQKRPTLKRARVRRPRPPVEAPPSSPPPANGNGRAHGYEGPERRLSACSAFALCQPRLTDLEQGQAALRREFADMRAEGTRVSSTLGLLLQAEEQRAVRDQATAETLIKVDKVLRLVCEAHGLDPEKVGD
jgi:hypothetical protein